MKTWLIYTLIGVGAFIVSLFFEDVREFYSEQLEMVWDGILYFFTFAWFGDLWDFYLKGNDIWGIGNEIRLHCFQCSC